MSLQPLNVFERFPEIAHQTGTLLIDHVLPEENQRCADEQSNQSYDQTKSHHRRRGATDENIPSSQEQSREHSEHSEARGPLSVSPGRRWRRLRFECQVVRHNSRDPEPYKGRKCRQSNERAAVEPWNTHGQGRQNKSYQVERSGSEKMAVNSSPCAFGAKKKKSESGHHDEIFDHIAADVARVE